MRVIITGHAGTSKAKLAQKLTDFTLSKRGISPKHPASKQEIAWFEVEGKEWLGVDFLTFVTNYDESQQRQTWVSAFQKINRSIKPNRPKDVILLIHATCYRNGRFFSAVSWDDLLLFRPDCIITLTDDVYDAWQRIEEGPHDTHFSLQEILNWRSVEILYSKALAEDLRFDLNKLSGVNKVPQKMKHLFGPALPVFLMSVKHPVETFYHLLFERSNRPLVYASFPITRTRSSKKRRDDIDSFRLSLRESGVIVIDPLTIDELRLEENDPRWLKLRDDAEYKQYQTERWPISTPSVEPPNNYSKNPFVNLTDIQIKDLVTALYNHVVDRDFRLVSQCKRLVAYRPFYPKEGDERIGPPTADSTGGVTREINFALGLQQSVWAFHPKCDHHPLQDTNFFDRQAVWDRVRRFPQRTEIPKLNGKDSSGFETLLKELKELI